MATEGVARDGGTNERREGDDPVCACAEGNIDGAGSEVFNGKFFM